MADSKIDCIHKEQSMDEIQADTGLHTDSSIPREAEPTTAYSAGWKTFAAIIALSLANCCAVVTNTTNTTIKFQVETLGNASLESWIANGNFLVTLAFGPAFGSLSDRLGKKWFIVGGCIVGIIGSCISGSAASTIRIVGGNILTGLANAGCLTSIAANQEITPNYARPLAFGINQTMGSSMAILGTFVAAAFVEHNTGGHGGWRWAYYFNAIVYSITAVAVFVTYFPPPPLLRRQGQLKKILSHADYIGILLLCGSLASLLIGLTWGGTTYPWSSGKIIATLTCGCVGLVIFGLWEWLGKSDGLFDHRLLKTANFPILLFVCLIDGMLLLGVNVLYAQEIADLFTTNAIHIAVILCPYLITSTFGCFPAGWIMARTKSYRILLVGALLWCSLFTGLMALINPNRLAMACVFSALFGIATAVTTVIPIVALTLSIPSFLLGTAGTISVSTRALGGIIGITIFTAIFDNKYAAHLRTYVPAVVTEQGYNATVAAEVMDLLSSPNPAALPTSGLPARLIGAVEAAVALAKQNSWTFVWVAIACLVAANAVAACFLKSVAPNMNYHIESALEASEVRQAQLEEAKVVV